MSLIRANRLFKEKNYKDAYPIYQRLKLIYGESIKYNILECEKNIKLNTTPVEISTSNIKKQDDESLNYAFNKLGIDCCYIVNLKRRPDRKLKALREFKRHGITPVIIDAEDALISQDTLLLYERYLKRTIGDSLFTKHILKPKQIKDKRNVSIGAFAYLLSQKKVIEDAIKKGHKKICVFDDDVFFTDNSVGQILRYIEKSKNNQKIVLLGASEYFYEGKDALKKAVAKSSIYWAHPGRTCGSFGMIYDSSIYKELLTVIEDADGTYDNYILGHFYDKYRGQCHVLTPNICIPSVDESDIRDGKRDQELQSEKMLWNISNYDRWKSKLRVSVIVTNLDTIKYITSFNILNKNDISLSIYYISKKDGLRPLISGKGFSKELLDSKDILNTFESLNEEEQINKLNNIGLPFSDITIIWPSHLDITENLIQDFCINSFEKDKKKIKKRVFLDLGIKATKGLTSIIIPSFRPVKQIWPTILSALRQENANIEVIVINDNPNTENFVKDINNYISKESSKKVKSVKLIVTEHTINRNASAARNTGLFLSKGEYISFLDDDDLYAPSRVANAKNSLDKSDNKIGATYCGYSGSWNGHVDEARFKEGNLGKEIYCLNYATHYICTNTVTFKRDALIRLGGFNESYRRHQDIELNARFFKDNDITSTKTFDVKNRPTPVDSTFSPTKKSLLELKMKFISDFSKEIKNMNIEIVDELLNAHAKDIYKMEKISDSEKLLILNVLKKLIY